MNNNWISPPHPFHIPVMGSGFSIDTPLKVARYGISSVVSLVDDVLIEQMRAFHCKEQNLPYTKISESDPDPRARRITAYLEMLDQIVSVQIQELRNSPFEPESEITRYFELLPESPTKVKYRAMLSVTDDNQKSQMQTDLRQLVTRGSIDVNIMTKLDRDRYDHGEKMQPEFADAMTGLRGFANSSLDASIIFSAGMNRRLFSYLASFEDFFPDASGLLKKKIVLKVSDYRSAMIQGKYLAKRGLWVSEFRVESGLNCGGHAFATGGSLMGPILEEFKRYREELTVKLHEIYNQALTKVQRSTSTIPLPVRITAQGGIGTAAEDQLLMTHYGVDGTGWGTPFLLVPEVTRVDQEHLKRLLAATEDDVCLSDHSPLGVPFWSLNTSASENVRRKRIENDKPGSPCPKGFLVSNTEFTQVPICHASRVYQKRKIRELEAADHSAERLAKLKAGVVSKACICHDLGGGVKLELGIDKTAKPAICCGPNIINFSKIASLEEMVAHIYGRLSLLTTTDRPHMFICELTLYKDHLKDELARASENLVDKTTKYFDEFKQNLIDGIEHYRTLAEQASLEQKERFLRELDTLVEDIEALIPAPAPSVVIGRVS